MRVYPVQTFSESLRELHVTCGKPSYARIRGLAHGHALSPATISEVLNGKRMPRLEFVVSFVRALLRHRDGADLGARHEAEVRRWRLRWQQAQLSATSRSTAPGAEASRPGTASPRAPRRPPRAEPLPPAVDGDLLDRALTARDDRGRRWADARHGCWALYDLDGVVVHIGRTSHTLAAAVREHLADPGAALDVREVAELELWPAWGPHDPTALDRLERAVWRGALGGGGDLPPFRRFPLLDERTRRRRRDGDARIARHAERLAGLAAAVAEGGRAGEEVRRALAVRAARLARLTAEHYAAVTGRPVADLDDP